MGELHNTYNDSACNCIVHALNALGELMDGRHTLLNRMLIITASIFALVALIGTASATDYYISTTGNNGENGLTLGTAWASIQYGFETMNAGDTLYIVNGTYKIGLSQTAIKELTAIAEAVYIPPRTLIRTWVVQRLEAEQLNIEPVPGAEVGTTTPGTDGHQTQGAGADGS